MTILRNFFFRAGAIAIAIAMISLVTSGVADIGSLFGLELDVIFIAAGITVGALAIAVMIQALGVGGHRGLGVVAVAVLALSAGLFGAGLRHKFFTSPATTNQSHATASGLAFRVPENASVPECNVYAGDGRIPDGYSLVIFDRPVDDSRQGTDGYYMGREPARNNDNSPGWHTHLLDTGSPRVEIAAVLMTDDLFQALLSIKPNAGGEADAWKSWALPPGEQLRSLVVEPRLRTAADPSGCPH